MVGNALQGQISLKSALAAWPYHASRIVGQSTPANHIQVFQFTDVARPADDGRSLFNNLLPDFSWPTDIQCDGSRLWQFQRRRG
jgi:hypothetical protein